MAVGFPTKANWAAGDVLTASQMDDLAGTVNTVQNFRPWNPVLNSNMSVWQRGTTVATATTSTAYQADRWQLIRPGYTTGATAYRYATNDTTNLPNIQYCARVQRDSGNTSTLQLWWQQCFESINSVPFAGKTVTVSFYARKGADYSASGSTLGVALSSGTGTDQNFSVSGYTGGTTVASTSAILTATWQRFTFTGTVPTNCTELTIRCETYPVGTALTNDYYEITGVQLELGSVANTYQPNGSTYQAELALCQRYYWRNTVNAAYGLLSLVNGASSTTTVYAPVQFPVTMRIAPTSLEYPTSYTGVSVGDGTNRTAVTALALDSASVNSTNVQATVASGLTQYRPSYVQANNSATAFLGFSAEL